MSRPATAVNIYPQKVKGKKKEKEKPGKEAKKDINE